MDYEIKIPMCAIQFQATAEMTILESALTNKIYLQHSCKKGSCGVCIADILNGSVKNEMGVVVSSGSILTCCSYPQSDLSLKADYYPELTEIECVTLPCRVSEQNFINEDLLILKLRLPPSSSFNYLPGQYIDLIYGGERRSYSIANVISDTLQLELHIRLIPGGAFSQLLLSSGINKLMRLEGPKGTFFIRQSEQPIIFLAGGTGFAPVKAMVEDLLKKNTQREIYIYWGVSHPDYLYTDIVQAWSIKNHHIHYVPVVSQSVNGWSGREGFVHQAVVDDFDSLEEYHVYACGALDMINAAKNAFFEKGLLNTNFYSDAFVCST